MPNEAPDTSVSENKPAGPTFMQIPLEIARHSHMTQTAKLLYGRLLLFAGKDGFCNPSHETLANEISVRPRQIRNALSELAAWRLVSWKRTKSSASYTVNGPCALFNPDRQHNATLDRQSIATQTGNVLPIKRGIKRGSLKDVDIDCPPSANLHALPPSKPKQYPQLKALLTSYMSPDPKKPSAKHAPTDRQVADIYHAGQGEDEAAICRCVTHLYNERGLRPGTENGPRHFKWFPTVVYNYFTELMERQDSRPQGFDDWADRNDTRAANRGY